MVLRDGVVALSLIHEGGQGAQPEGIGKMKFVEIAEGTVGVTAQGTFFQMGETDITKVEYVRDDEVFVLGGAVSFKIDDVRFI